MVMGRKKVGPGPSRARRKRPGRASRGQAQGSARRVRYQRVGHDRQGRPSLAAIQVSARPATGAVAGVAAGSLRLPGPAARRAERRGLEAARRARNRARTTVSDVVLPALRVWRYRLTLLGLTIALLAMLLRVQDIISRMPATLPAFWQHQIRWVEVLWLTPLPLAVALWVGWFVFAEAARPDPRPVAAPGQVHLVFRFCSRGENAEVLADSVAAVHRAIAAYGRLAGPYTVEVVSDQPVDVGDAAVVYVVPQGYETAHRSRYKARALTYLQHVRQPNDADWHIYLDEESVVDAAVLAGIYEFIGRAQDRARRTERPTARLIGQGGLLYQGGAAIFRGADALRTGDDLGRFRLQYALGVPMFGIHGSYLVVRGVEEATLSFDVGPSGSITEDAAWALRAWARGWRLGWVRGYVHEQPPQRVMDFVRQRARWLSGIRAVVGDGSVPLRYRAILIGFMLLWQASVLPLGIAVVALATHVQPFTWARLPADFAWVTFVLAYLHGLNLQATRRHPLEGEAGEQTGGMRTWLRCQVDRVLEWPLILGLFWYSLLEVAGVLYSLRPRQGFYVIAKPRLAGAAHSQTPQSARGLVSGEAGT
jgi:beta-1,4-mannosyltransferase